MTAETMEPVGISDRDENRFAPVRSWSGRKIPGESSGKRLPGDFELNFQKVAQFGERRAWVQILFQGWLSQGLDLLSIRRSYSLQAPWGVKKNQIMSKVLNLPGLKSRDHIKYSKSLHGRQKRWEKVLMNGFYFFNFKRYFKSSRSFGRPAAFFILIRSSNDANHTKVSPNFALTLFFQTLSNETPFT